MKFLPHSLEKDAIFPENTSPTDAHWIFQEGDILLHSKGEVFRLKKQEYFDFTKKEKHWMKAHINFNFLVIR